MTAGYAAWMALLAGSYCAFPSLRVLVWTLIGLSGVAGIMAGVAANRPAGRAPWLLLAGASLSLAVAQLNSLMVSSVLRPGIPSPLTSDVFALASYALAAAGLLIFLWWRGSGEGLRGLLDALTFTTGLGLATWLCLILLPHAQGLDLTPPDRALAISYPLGDVLLLVMLARLLAPGPAQASAARLLALGAAGMLASDIWYSLSWRHGSVDPGVLGSLGWVLCYACWGAAAIDPAMRSLTRPVLRQQAENTASRLAPILVATLIAPAFLVAVAMQRSQQGAGLIAGTATLLGLLILGRLADAAAAQRRALGREQILRKAATSLAATASPTEVATVTRATVTALTGPYARAALLALRHAHGFIPPGPADPYAADLDATMDLWAPTLAVPGPHLVPATTPAGGGSRSGTGQHGVLLCPLADDDGHGTGAQAGVLAVFGETRTLAGLLQPIEDLARQVAAALDRILMRREMSRRDSAAYFRAVAQDISDIILVLGDDGRVRSATRSASKIFGTSSVEGVYLWDLVQPEERDTVTRSFARMRDQAVPGTPERWVMTRSDGRPAEVEVICTDLRRDDTVGGLLVTLRDVTKRRALERELQHRAFHDALTGLANRLLFQDRATQALARRRRTGATVAVLVIDLDDFSSVNDTLGHSVGDELLVAAAGRLSAMARESDTAARLGADEFALLIEDAGGDGDVQALAERIVAAFAVPFQLVGASVVTTATVGIATTEDSADAGDLVRHADLALYAAKAAGKRQWRRYQPVLSVTVDRQRELKAAIEDAVAGSAFTLTYQPIVVLATNEIVGFEALVRWPHPRWGMIHPDQFITLAEETGHIVELGTWVLRQAVSDLVTWQRELPRRVPLYVSVNVSARQFRDPGLVSSVHEILSETGLTPSLLLLELTESVLLGRESRTISELTDLKRLGVKLAIDDFGTGYSSLSYLRELPLDVLKIDRSFIEGIATSKTRLALVEIIIRIAKTFGLTVVSEGIESELQRELLISLGCELGQGYLLERPMGADEAAALIRARLVPGLHPSGDQPAPAAGRSAPDQTAAGPAPLPGM
jgi:diguanylate cyclase (GGDEF)-like protein/PAS domain S-box-containing protein